MFSASTPVTIILTLLLSLATSLMVFSAFCVEKDKTDHRVNIYLRSALWSAAGLSFLAMFGWFQILHKWSNVTPLAEILLGILTFCFALIGLNRLEKKQD